MTTRSRKPKETPAGRGCRRRLLIAGLVFLVLAAVLAITVLWRLSRGPIELAFLEPHLVWKLGSDEEALQLAIKHPVLAWGGWRRPADLRAGPVTVSDAQGQTVVEFEDVSVGIALRELIHKRVALTRVEIRSIHLQLLRTADGRLVLGFEAGDGREKPPPSQSPSVFQEKLREVLTSPTRVPPFDRLTVVSVVKSRATIDDRMLGRTWHVPNLDLEIKPRETELNVSANATVDLAVDGAATAEISPNRRVTSATVEIHTEIGGLDGTFEIDDQGSISADATVTQFQPWKLAGLSSVLDRICGGDHCAAGPYDAAVGRREVCRRPGSHGHGGHHRSSPRIDGPVAPSAEPVLNGMKT